MTPMSGEKDMRGKPLIPANIVTVLRMVGTVVLLFLRPFSDVFLVVYALTGVTDVLDGWIARSTGTESELGARLDSIADLMFYTVMLVKVFPLLLEMLPVQLWVCVCVALALRLGAYGTAALKYHRFAAIHTYLNKLTGAAIFLVPFLIKTPIGFGYCWGVCVVGMIASGEELLIHIISRKYDACVKTILHFLGEN